MSSITCRIATPGDIPGMLALQEACYIGNLPPQARGSGFLSVRFSRRQFSRMMDEAGIVVAAGAGGVIAGYLCAASLDGGGSSPILARLVELINVVEYRGAPLGTFRPFLYGPVCLHETLRGQGLLPVLYAQLKRHVAGRYGTGVAFVSLDNPRSLRAHVEKLGMTAVCEFSVDHARYALLAFDVNPD